MSEEEKATESKEVVGGKFDEPLFIRGGVTGEPERYLGEKPYELDKYEFSVLKRNFDNKSFWFHAVCGATAGFVILITAKIVQSLINQKPPTLESYEIIAVIIGIGLAFWLRKPKLSVEEIEKEKLKNEIDRWFIENPKRRIHVTEKREGEV